MQTETGSIGRCQWALRGAQLTLWCAALMPKILTTVTSDVRAGWQSPAGPGL